MAMNNVIHAWCVRFCQNRVQIGRRARFSVALSICALSSFRRHQAALESKSPNPHLWSTVCVDTLSA